MPIEVSHPLPKDLLFCDFTAYVTEVGGVEPLSLVRTDQDVEIQAGWYLDGALAEFICGLFVVRAYLESIGPGPEIKTAAVEVELVPTPGRNQYRATLRIPAGTIQTDGDVMPFKLVTGLTYRTPSGQPGPIAGAVEGPILNFYGP